LSPAEKTGVAADAALQDGIIKFIADDIGTYPFDSTGVVLFRIPELAYALEVQTKSHFTWVPMYRDVLAHEIAHQWYGDYVSPATWREVWFNEGFATWWQWYWDNQQGGAARTVEEWFTLLYDHSSQTWDTAPANLPDASWMFDNSTIYRRPAMMHEAYRQIAGDATFFALQRAILSEHAYGNITTAQFIARAKSLAQERSGFDAAYLAKLDEFFQQWLYGIGKPALTPSTFFLDLQPRMTIRFVSPSELEISWPSTSAMFSLEETDDLTATLWNPVLSSQVETNGETRVTLGPPAGNRFFRLRKN
jgi:aminopeptidase N